MTTANTPLQPVTIIKHIGAADRAFAVLAACQLDVFTPLKDGPLNAEQIAAAISVNPVKLRPLLYALVIAELLTVADGLFANTAESDYFLVKGRPNYRGGGNTLWNEIFHAELKTADSILTDTPQAKHDYSVMSRDELKAIVLGMHASTLDVGRLLASQYDFSTCRTLLDVGGGAGGLAITLTELHPHMHATVVELPGIVPIAQEVIEQAGMAERVRVMAANVVKDGINGVFDAATMKAVIQTMSAEDARRAILNVGKAINPGGMIYICGQVLDNSRLTPPSVVALNIAWVSLYDGGQAYTEQEYFDWLHAAGFEGCQRIMPAGDSFSFISARKRA